MHQCISAKTAFYEHVWTVFAAKCFAENLKVNMRLAEDGADVRLNT